MFAHCNMHEFGKQSDCSGLLKKWLEPGCGGTDIRGSSLSLRCLSNVTPGNLYARVLLRMYPEITIKIT